jgi:hypothetical protein
MPPIYIPVPPGGETPPEGGNGLHPSHPIVIPPSEGVPEDSQKYLVHVYVAGVGGVWFLIQPPPVPTHPWVPPTPPAQPKPA